MYSISTPSVSVATTTQTGVLCEVGWSGARDAARGCHQPGLTNERLMVNVTMERETDANVSGGVVGDGMSGSSS